MLITVRGSRGRRYVGMECSRTYHIVVLRALLAAAGALVSVLVCYHQARCELRATRRGEYLAVCEISEPLLPPPRSIVPSQLLVCASWHEQQIQR